MLSLSALRRLRTPAVIDSAPAPTFTVEHIDITDDDIRTPRPVVVDADLVDEATDFAPATVTAAAVAMRVERRAAVERGTCYHHVHVDMPRRGRLGLLVDGDRATLLPCPYANADGQ